MTQEDKDLLLKDLCARLPYRVKISVDDDYDLFIPRLRSIDGVICYFYECAWTRFIDQIKPYLRPMSSMTEKEKIIYQSKQTIIFDFKNNKLYVDNYYSLDYLNSIHVDYRGLIEKGLALEAPEGMYDN